MKKSHRQNYTFIFLLLSTLVIIGCEDKYDWDEGPADIRVENMSSQTYDSILVNTSGGENYYGSLSPGAQSDYKRFDFAYNTADISLYIDDVKYTHGPVDYTYLTKQGKGKFTYKIDIEDAVAHTLSITITADAPLDD